jgi:hypothetical protein
MLRMRRRLHHVMHAGKKGPFYTRRGATGQLHPLETTRQLQLATAID